MEESAVRKQLEAVAKSSYFLHADRLLQLLRYVVEAKLDDRTECISQKQLAMSVFNRDEHFDSAIDSIVRVEAGRLRSKLLEYYTNDGSSDPIRFELPKGQYVPRIYEYDIARQGKSDDGNEATPSIAVLPFENMSGDKEQDYFGDGISEDLLTDLAKFSNLLVIARNSSFRYKGSSLSVNEIGRELNVTHILEGSVRKSKDRIRITAQLIDVQTQHHLWAERYDRHLNDIFVVQDDVVGRIVNALQIQFPHEIKTRLRAEDNILKAYDLVLRGYSRAVLFSREANKAACELYEKALGYDPENSVAYARYSIARVYQGMMGWCSSRQETFQNALDLAQQAVRHNRELALAHTALGWAYNRNGKYDLAIESCRRGVELGPSDAYAHMFLAICLSPHGEYDEALQILNKAMQLDPHDPYYFPRGQAMFHGRRYEAAIELFKKSIKHHPNFLPSRILFAAACGQLGLIEEGREQLEVVEKLSPNHNIGKPTGEEDLVFEGLRYLQESI
jgi:adenylate cyclase